MLDWISNFIKPNHIIIYRFGLICLFFVGGYCFGLRIKYVYKYINTFKSMKVYHQIYDITNFPFYIS